MDLSISANSSDTIILWKNDVHHVSYENLSDVPINIHQQFKETCEEYKIPRGLSENFEYFLKKTAEDLVNHAIADTENMLQCSQKTNK